MTQAEGIPSTRENLEFRVVSSHEPYKLYWKNLGITIEAKYMHDTRVIHTEAELWVRNVDREWTEGEPEGHLSWGSVTLTSADSCTRFANKLKKKVPEIPWEDVLEQFTVVAIKAHREGAPEIEISEDLLPDRSEEKKWIIKPILEPNNVTIVYGPGSVGKSMFCLYLAVLIKEGISTEGLEVDGKLNVLYLDWETSMEEITDRVRMIRKGLGLPRGQKGIFYKPMVFGISRSVRELREIIKERDIGLVVLDSMGYAAAGDLESSTSARELHSALRYLGVSALCIHHISKDSMSRNSVSRPFGSIYYENMARHTFELKKEQEEDQSFLEIGMYDRKSNNVGKISPIGWEISFDNAGDATSAVTFKRRAISDTKLRKVVTVDEEIQRLLEDFGPMKRLQIAAALKDQKGIELEPDRISTEISKHRDRFVKLENQMWGSVNGSYPTTESLISVEEDV